MQQRTTCNQGLTVCRSKIHHLGQYIKRWVEIRNTQFLFLFLKHHPEMFVLKAQFPTSLLKLHARSSICDGESVESLTLLFDLVAFPQFLALILYVSSKSFQPHTLTSGQSYSTLLPRIRIQGKY